MTSAYLLVALAVIASVNLTEGTSRRMRYVGCYKDSLFNRDLEERSWDDDEMTLEVCAGHCNGYRYMGLQAGDQCRCADDYGERDEDSDGCRDTCEGDHTQICGDNWRNSVYEINNVAPVIKYMGCFRDEMFDRDLPARSWSSNSMTLELCASHCEGYTYMATQWHDECRCGNSYGEHGSDDNGCDNTCDGDSSQRCGSSWRNSVYKIKHEIEHLTFESIGDTVPRQASMKGRNKLFIPDWTNSVQSSTGKVIQWTYRSFDTEPVHLAFFRPSSDDQTLFSYVGGTDFTPTSIGDNVINLTESSQIDVIAGDAIGIYRAGAAPFNYMRYQDCTGRPHLLISTTEDGNFTAGELVTVWTRNHCGIPYVTADIRDI